MTSSLRSNYSEQELIALTDAWVEWVGYRSSQFILIRLMDLDRAMQALSPSQRVAIFLIGFCQLTQREAASLCGVSQPAMWARYQRGLQNMANFLNG